jgi:hypothetical protein
MDEQVELIYALIGRETCSAINIMGFKLHVTELAPIYQKDCGKHITFVFNC